MTPERANLADAMRPHPTRDKFLALAPVLATILFVATGGHQGSGASTLRDLAWVIFGVVAIGLAWETRDYIRSRRNPITEPEAVQEPVSVPTSLNETLKGPRSRTVVMLIGVAAGLLVYASSTGSRAIGLVLIVLALAAWVHWVLLPARRRRT